MVTTTTDQPTRDKISSIRFVLEQTTKFKSSHIKNSCLETDYNLNLTIKRLKVINWPTSNFWFLLSKMRTWTLHNIYLHYTHKHEPASKGVKVKNWKSFKIQVAKMVHSISPLLNRSESIGLCKSVTFSSKNIQSNGTTNP